MFSRRANDWLAGGATTWRRVLKCGRRSRPWPAPTAFACQTRRWSQSRVLLGSLRTFASVPGKYEALRRKSLLLTGYFELLLRRCVQDRFEDGTLEFLTPSDERARGCQLSLLFGGSVDAKHMFKRMQDRGIVVDFREPGSIRAAPVPLYNTFADVRMFVQTVVDLLEEFKVPQKSK